MSHIINPIITDRQRQIIIGTVLGGSSIIKPKNGNNCYLSMRDKNINWLRYKATELALLASENPYTTETTIRWHSICYPLFNELRTRLYKDNKRFIDVDILSNLKDIALGVWFVDCGKMVHDHAIFKTHFFGQAGSEEICKYFELCGWASSVTTERKSYRVKMDKDSSSQFLKTINPSLPYFILKSPINS